MNQPNDPHEGPAKAEVSTADEFNLWCAVNSRPYKLVQHVWDDGAVEWDIEVGTGRDDARVVYGTGQSDEERAVIAAFAFIAGADWAAADLTTIGPGDHDEDEGFEDEDDDSEDDDPDDDGRGGSGGGTRGRSSSPTRGSGGGSIAAPAGWAATAAVLELERPRPAPPATLVPATPQAPARPLAARTKARTATSRLPSIDLLSAARSEADAPLDEAELARNARSLETVLRNFGVRGEIMEVRTGPVVTLYELEPAPGTKSSRVIGLADDIARSMSAVTVRIAIVPGRSVIGIELPNPRRQTVFLRDILKSPAFADTEARLPLVLGRDIGGEPTVVDLARMPHLLIAGTTGSGKSVGINAMILSLLYKHTPEQVRFIMVDPKMLELSVYDGIPHLLTPVVTDPKKAVVALKWAVAEMENRYRAMSRLGVRNIEGYNARVAELRATGETVTHRIQTGYDRQNREPVWDDVAFDPVALPYIVVVVDEMADLMLVAGKDIEAAIQRLAQMARAAGIHLIMATQRPSVDVITGTIKANFPTRISFQVTSRIDSRTILGESGAEQLLGQGDMLYMAGGGRITRIHGPFVSDQEVEEVVRFVKSLGEPEYLHSITEDEADCEDAGDTEPGVAAGASGDDLYDQAVALVAREQRCSVSFIQRHLQIGYNRSARIVERMEQDGVVSQANHVGKRDVLIGRSDY